ncbi:hypothetical protein, partial [Acidithiobacillus caldus]|uniref:hypothetical protein n=1 Tax=Acidithiobacillus caldus TaxID=33059 RepID=UPI001A7E056A
MHPLAHWFAWNFFRLLYEPLPETQGRELALEWLMAHDMAYVGDGFLWPPLRIHSDGARVTLNLCGGPIGQDQKQVSLSSILFI